MMDLPDLRDQYEIRIQPLPAKLNRIGNESYKVISFIYEVWTVTMNGPHKLTTGTVSPYDVGRWDETQEALLPGDPIATHQRAMDLAEEYVDSLKMFFRSYM